MSDPHPLIIELRQLREQRGVTQVEMAEHLGTTQSAVSRLERNGDLMLSTVERYCVQVGARLLLDVADYDGNDPMDRGDGGP